jgi:predicted MFS family arabinose efflux permease
MTFLGLGLSLTGGAVLGLLVVFGSQAIGLAADDPRLPILFLAVGVGSLLGSLTLPRLTARVSIERITLVGLILNPLALVLLAVAPTLETAVPAMIVWQAIFIAVIINGISLRQRETPDELQSRVNVTARMIAWGGTPFGAMIGGLLVELATVRSAYLLMALPVTVAAIIGWFSPLRARRGSPPQVADAEAQP